MAERTSFPEPLANGPQRNGTNGLYYPSQAEAEDQEISLHEILEVLFKNKWVILACFILVLAGAAMYTLQQDPEYEANSTVYVKSQRSNAQLSELLGLETFNRNIANEIEIVKSRKIAMRVAEQMIDIERVPGTEQILSVLTSGDDEMAQDELGVAQRLQKNIRVQPVTRGVDIIELTVTSTIPEEAKLISNLWAEAYVEQNRTTSRARMAASREFLDNVTEQFSVQLRSAEDELTSFFNRERLVAPDAEAQELIEQLSDLNQQRNKTLLELGMAQAEIRGVTERIEQIRPTLASQIASGEDLFIEGLLEEISKLGIQIKMKYARNPGLEQNPSQDEKLMGDLRALEDLRTDLKTRSERVAGSRGLQSAANGLVTLDRLQQQTASKQIEASTLEARLSLLDGQVNQVEVQYRDIPRKQVMLSRLNRSRLTTEQLYVTLREKLQEAQIAEQSELGYIEVVDEAILPVEPVRPRVRLNLVLGALLGLVLGIGLAFVRNAVDNKVRKPEDLRKRGHNVIGLVPNMDRVIRQDFKGQEFVGVDGREYSTRLISLLNPLSPISEGYRRVRTNIQFSRPDTRVQTIMVTSPGPGEGKTVTALNLAITMAQAGRRTLYVDADLRRPQGHRLMGMDRDAGLVDLLFDTLPDTVEQFATSLDSYLYVIPAGRDVPNPAEVLGSRRMQKLLAHWQQAFDVILIDTPPTLIVADALILATQCDATLVVCSAGETTWQAVDRCNEALEGVGTDVIGVLLNRFDAKAAYGGYKYGYGYGNEYGYGNYYYYGPSSHRSARAARKV